MSQRMLIFGVVCLVAAAPLAAPLTAQDPDVVKIGLTGAKINELSPSRKKFVDVEFSQMVLDFTGMKSAIILGGTYKDAVKKLDDGEWQLAVFQGVEFAWARTVNPKLQPIMLATYRTQDTRAQLVVKSDSGMTSADQLKGKTVYLLNKLHCELFADRLGKTKAKDYFAKVLPTTNVELALDAVLLGKVQAAVVDNAGMEVYRDVFPGRFDKLKSIAESERFPSGAIAYRPGGLSDKAVGAFRAGMLKANDSDKGREAMATFQITRFEPVPSDYDVQLSAILKSYPPPE